jgi:type I restriction enzyme S subunit
MATSQDFVNWVCGPELLPQFLKYVLVLENEALWRFASGTTHQTIYYPEAKAFHVCIPPLSVQHEIVYILGTLDDKIELNRQMNQTLDEIARTLFRSWFVDFDPVRTKAEGRQPDGMDAETAALFPDRLVDSELGPIPEGWEWGSLDQIADNIRDNVPASELVADENYVGLEHFGKRQIALYEWESASKVSSNKSRFREGDVLFGKLRPYFHKVCQAPVDGVCSTDILVIRPRCPEDLSLILAVASSDAMIEHATQRSSGTRMPRANWSDVGGFRVALPPSNIRSAFGCALQPMLELVTRSIHESITLAELRDTLLPELLSGRLSVKSPTDAT